MLKIIKAYAVKSLFDIAAQKSTQKVLQRKTKNNIIKEKK